MHCSGLCSKEVVLALGISERAIKAHLSKIKEDSRVAAIAAAVGRGWLGVIKIKLD